MLTKALAFGLQFDVTGDDRIGKRVTDFRSLWKRRKPSLWKEWQCLSFCFLLLWLWLFYANDRRRSQLFIKPASCATRSQSLTCYSDASGIDTAGV